jgi:2-polyprenyl-3-methyl-5-hydroxy-6-metoxy-1,4-benzoquinol methylase
VGGGSSALAGELAKAGMAPVLVVDIAPAALDLARGKAGKWAGAIEWRLADVTTGDALGTFDVWHDRAVFHFLTQAPDRERYADLAARTVRPGGVAIVGAFGPQGPTTCSGLPVTRYDERTLAEEMGPAFALQRSELATHTTPLGAEQQFLWAVFARER